MTKTFIILVLFNIVAIFTIVLLVTKTLTIRSKNKKVKKFKKYTFDK